MKLKLAYIGTKDQKLEGLRFEALDLITQIKEHRIPNYEKDRLNMCIEDIKDCADPLELNGWIDDLRTDLNGWENKEFEEQYAYRNYPQDDYGEGYYQKI
jgi:hypothetical protein